MTMKMRIIATEAAVAVFLSMPLYASPQSGQDENAIQQQNVNKDTLQLTLTDVFTRIEN